MKTISLIPGTTTLRSVDRPEPEISAVDQIKAILEWRKTNAGQPGGGVKG